jgi:hypothetical protein
MRRTGAGSGAEAESRVITLFDERASVSFSVSRAGHAPPCMASGRYHTDGARHQIFVPVSI